MGRYDPWRAGLDFDLRFLIGPIKPILATIDPIRASPIRLNHNEVDDLRAAPESLCDITPKTVPSGMPGAVASAVR